MRRRTVLLGGAAGAMLAAAGARAQQAARQYRIAVLSPLSGLASGPYLIALREQLARHGFVEGRNLTLDVRTPSLGHQAGVAAARELIALKPDAILSCGTALTKSVQDTTRSVPIVFTWVADPALSGILSDLSKPGANVTGITNRNFELTAKRLELIRELLPSARRVALVAGIFDSVVEASAGFAERAARALEVDLARIEAGVAWPEAVPRAVQEKADAALLLTPFAFFGMRLTMEEFVHRAKEHRLPAMYMDSETVEAGGLMSYATNLADDMRRGADRLARVLRGEKPGDLAVDQASRFELAINLKTASAIGVAVPRSLLVRADRVIE